jgi:hypothetical protein
VAAYFTTADGVDVVMHVGQGKPNVDVEQISSVQLDGHELNHVHSKFSDLPKSNGRIVKYFGDHAKFIFANW